MPNPNQIQQGDVTLERIDQLPDGFVPVDIDGDIVLAEGSRSGNRHYFAAPDVTLFQHADGRRAIRNANSAAIRLKHTKDHDDLVVDPGFYLVGNIREIDHLTGLVDKVVD